MVTKVTALIVNRASCPPIDATWGAAFLTRDSSHLGVLLLSAGSNERARESSNSGAGGQFIVASEVMTNFTTIVEREARHTGTVLISGEIGGGKELIAHAIHERSLTISLVK